MSLPAPQPAPGRVVHCADALGWLRASGPLVGASVVTSLPDVSELPTLGFAGWRQWFVDAAELTARSVPDDGVVIFFQSDIRHEGRWVDKGRLCSEGAERAGLELLFHKIVCRKPPGTSTLGRATYAHLLAFARQVRPAHFPTPDVLADGGFVVGRKAMGLGACALACRFVRDETPSRTIVDPFCGWGTVLAVANALGLDAVGVDLSARMCRRARGLAVDLQAGVARPAERLP
jgi:hypothetical protein